MLIVESGYLLHEPAAVAIASPDVGIANRHSGLQTYPAASVFVHHVGMCTFGREGHDMYALEMATTTQVVAAQQVDVRQFAIVTDSAVVEATVADLGIQAYFHRPFKVDMAYSAIFKIAAKGHQTPVGG